MAPDICSPLRALGQVLGTRMKSILLMLLCMPLTAFAQQIQAELQCRYVGMDFAYDCTIRLSRSGAPLPGAQFTVAADMPSMPMAHNVKPAKAAPGSAPGEYRARLNLEMMGEWAVKISVAVPLRDQIILHYQFDERGARQIR